jgi:hypothetical protein
VACRWLDRRMTEATRVAAHNPIVASRCSWCAPRRSCRRTASLRSTTGCS